MLLNQISRNIENTYMMDAPNIANIIYNYIDTSPKCLVVSTDTFTTRDFYKLDQYEFIALPENNRQLMNSYMSKLNTQLIHRGYSNKLQKDTIVIDRVIVDGEEKDFNFISLENGQLWPLFSLYSLVTFCIEYPIDFFIKYNSELKNRWFIWNGKYKQQFTKNMVIDENNYAYTYLYDLSYMWNSEQPTKIVMKIALKYDNEWIVPQAYSFFGKLELDKKYSFSFYETSLRTCLCVKYDQPQLKEIVCKSIGYDSQNNTLYLNFDTQW